MELSKSSNVESIENEIDDEIEDFTSTEEVRRAPVTECSEIQVIGTDRGISLTEQEYKEVADVAREWKNFCVQKPVQCPLIFGEWDVLYCSNPTSPGGGYRSGLGRLVFKTKEMIQTVEAPDTVKNKVSFSLFVFLDEEVRLNGKLIVLDEEWIQVIFEALELKVRVRILVWWPE